MPLGSELVVADGTLPGVQPCLPSVQAASRAQGAYRVALACAATGRAGRGRRIAEDHEGTSSGEDGVPSGRAGSHATMDERSGSAVDHTRKWFDAALLPDVACHMLHGTHALATILSEAAPVDTDIASARGYAPTQGGLCALL